MIYPHLRKDIEMIKHIVMWKFREGEEENVEKFLTGLAALQGVIPELLESKVSKNVVPGGYDAVLEATFESVDALNRYKNDPRHVAVSSLCKSIRESRASVDYEI